MEPQHNYLKKIRRLVRTGKLSKDFNVEALDILHDDWCPCLDGGICTCDPDVQVRPLARPGDNN